MAVQVDASNEVIVPLLPNSVRRSYIQRNNLEKYLDYIKEQETDYCIGQKEVTFIQTGIENLVQMIYDRITKENELRRMDVVNDDCVLKVGSFYEGTKNKFPDEFDFIFVFAVLEVDEIIPSKYCFRSFVQDVLHENLVYSDNAEKKISFGKFVEEKDPASKLKFIYQKEKFKDKYLHVDIVPAFKIVDPNLDVSVKEICCLEPFRDEILRTGSYLRVGDNLGVSFTETEVHFVRNVLSKKHVTVYKLLKYLLGGHGQAEIVREEIKGEGFSSYMIKIGIIRHHYECENTDSEDKGPCVMTVLQNLLRYKREECYPMLTDNYYFNSHGDSEFILENKILKLRQMQKSTNSCKLELTPVGKQRLEMLRRENLYMKCYILMFVIAAAVFYSIYLIVQFQ